ncbi:MAG: hypothetical protein N838_29770 [Thiohalocapsa sp. PB-PSB1]|nr:MAG: hypothetical protein N838_29770 [Thiohalocapsa sp. PB-PSB1]
MVEIDALARIGHGQAVQGPVVEQGVLDGEAVAVEERLQGQGGARGHRNGQRQRQGSHGKDRFGHGNTLVEQGRPWRCDQGAVAQFG